jgi:hypothetical protein
MLTFLRSSEGFELSLQRRLPVLSRFIVLVRGLMRRAEVDRAVGYGVLGTAWSLISGPVTAVLIATRFVPELQGYYYTFISILALQVFAELGLANVIVQFASHEWSKLHLDVQGSIVGESEALSRLVSLGRLAFGWYFVASWVVAIGMGLGGYIFFSQSVYAGIDWVAPWFVLCILSSITLWLVPALSLLEGCNQIARVYAFRAIRGVLTSLSVWAAILLGAGLWTAAAAALVGIVCSGAFLVTRYRRFFNPFFSHISGPRIGWRTEIWPMQWRIALSWLSGYFISSLFTPILFHYHGAIVAGQMGMTWSLLGALAGVTSMWSATKAPRFGMLIAKKEYVELDRLFFRVTWASLGVLLAGAVAVWSLVFLLNALHHPLAARLLPLLPTGLFLLGHIAMYAGCPLSVYLRAHKKEPLLGLSVVSGILIGLFLWLLGSRFAATGAAGVYLAVSAGFNLPYIILIWYRSRAAWHSDAATHSLTSCAQ